MTLHNIVWAVNFCLVISSLQNRFPNPSACTVVPIFLVGVPTGSFLRSSVPKLCILQCFSYSTKVRYHISNSHKPGGKFFFIISEACRYHVSRYEGWGLVVCDAVQFGTYVPTFRRHVASTFRAYGG